MTKHRADYKKKYKNGLYHYVSIFDLFDKYGLENCKIQLVKDVPCERKEQLRKIEGEYIQKENCVNKRIPGRDSKAYYQEHKEEAREYNKQYYKDNYDILREKGKKYREDHKEEINARDREYRRNDREKLVEHSKCYYEAHKEAFLEKNKQYRILHKDKLYEQHKGYVEEHKEQIKEYKNQWWLENKDKINARRRERVNCPHCLANLSRRCLSTHIKNKHSETLNNK